MVWWGGIYPSLFPHLFPVLKFLNYPAPPPKDHWFQFLQTSVVLGWEVDFMPAWPAISLEFKHTTALGNLLPLSQPSPNYQGSILKSPFCSLDHTWLCPVLHFSPGTPLCPCHHPGSLQGNLRFIAGPLLTWLLALVPSVTALLLLLLTPLPQFTHVPNHYPIYLLLPVSFITAIYKYIQTHTDM